MTKFNGTESTMEMLVAMAEGNPGAATVLAQTINHKWKNNIPGLLVVLHLDDLEIYGSDIWVLYKNCCGEDLDKMGDVIHASVTGKLSAADIKLHIENQESSWNL